jgi:hypothetical protein
MFVSAQEFMGVKVGGSRQEVINAFKAKGFTVVNNSPEEKTIRLSGNLSGSEIELYASFTPVSKVCWAFTVFFPEQTSWHRIKSQYNEYLDILVDKYGTPDNRYNFFSSPYYEGDGYEMSAIRLEKCTYAAFWPNVSIQISKYKQVKIHYENLTNANLDDEEKKKMNMKNL